MKRIRKTNGGLVNVNIFYQKTNINYNEYLTTELVVPLMALTEAQVVI